MFEGGSKGVGQKRGRSWKCIPPPIRHTHTITLSHTHHYRHLLLTVLMRPREKNAKIQPRLCAQPWATTARHWCCWRCRRRRTLGIPWASPGTTWTSTCWPCARCRLPASRRNSKEPFLYFFTFFLQAFRNNRIQKQPLPPVLCLAARRQ